MNTTDCDTAMEHPIYDELKAIHENRNANNIFIIPDDDDGLTGELASLDSLSNLQEELSMSSHSYFGESNVYDTSTAENMDYSVALIEEEDSIFSNNDCMTNQACTRWKPTPDKDSPVPSESSSSTIQYFTQVARDIKLAEDTLVENGVERSLAQQLAVSMKTSQAVVESQRRAETQRMMIQSHHRKQDRLLWQRQHEQRLAVESYHRNQDRQWSQRQHEESLQASKYDPEWSEKLEKKRQECWNLVTQMGKETLFCHYFSMVLKPMSFRELASFAMNSICDCKSSTDRYLLSSVWDSMSGTRGFKDLVWYVDYMANDSGLCYSSCMFTFGGKIACIALVHSGLRLFSAPYLLHQVVNFTAAPSLLGGPLTKLLSQCFSLEAQLSFSWIHLMAIVLLAGYALVQWNYYSCQKRVQEASKSPMTFPEAFESSLGQMKTLHTQLSFCRYLMIGAFIAFLNDTMGS